MALAPRGRQMPRLCVNVCIGPLTRLASRGPVAAVSGAGENAGLEAASCYQILSPCQVPGSATEDHGATVPVLMVLRAQTCPRPSELGLHLWGSKQWCDPQIKSLFPWKESLIMGGGGVAQPCLSQQKLEP